MGPRLRRVAWLVGALAALPLQAAQPVAPDAAAVLAEAERQRTLGLFRSAERTLQPLTAAAITHHQRTELMREWGLALLGQGRLAEAEVVIGQGLEAARLADAAGLEAALINDLGTVLAARGDPHAAVPLFGQAFEAARGMGDSALAFTATTNRARAALRLLDVARFETSVAAALDIYDSRETLSAEQWLAIGALQQSGVRELGLPASWRQEAFTSYQRAHGLASEREDSRSASYALGFLGSLYVDEQRLDEALQLSRQAEMLAMASGADEALYRWQWQSAQVLRAQGERDAAIAAFRQAIATLGRLRPNLGQGEGISFRERAAPVFFEYADLLLSRTGSPQNPEIVENNLREVRATLEQVKVAEVQEYFQDQCVQAAGGSTELDAVGAGSAIIYPILLPDRTELLVSMPGGMKQFTTAVGSAELTREVREFREQIERYDFRTDYRRQAGRLYDWLIRPMEDDLAKAGIDTLVIVPDGPLRTIPLSALFDGRQFLVERFAIATTPGLTLTSPQPLAREEVDMFAGGLTQAVQGFSSLPNVGTELERISARFPSETLRDQQFLVDDVQQRIAQGEQEIVHIATHGQFDSDHTQSFLLAYDDKITMDRLQSTIAQRGRQQEPLELLVLSACQTAAGDDRAALGLAGVALKAGARSALASLWFVNDESTARMVEDFYAQLGDPANSKARALQMAQLALIRSERFSHPAFWAPFLLIGNWL